MPSTHGRRTTRVVHAACTKLMPRHSHSRASRRDTAGQRGPYLPGQSGWLSCARNAAPHVLTTVLVATAIVGLYVVAVGLNFVPTTPASASMTTAHLRARPVGTPVRPADGPVAPSPAHSPAVATTLPSTRPLAFDALARVSMARKEPMRVYQQRPILMDGEGRPVDVVIPLGGVQCTTAQAVRRMNALHRPRTIWFVSVHEENCNLVTLMATNVKCVLEASVCFGGAYGAAPQGNCVSPCAPTCAAVSGIHARHADAAVEHRPSPAVVCACVSAACSHGRGTPSPRPVAPLHCLGSRRDPRVWSTSLLC